MTENKTALARRLIRKNINFNSSNISILILKALNQLYGD